MTSGAVGVGTAEMAFRTMWETVLRTVRRGRPEFYFDPDALPLGPDLGALGMLGLWTYSTQFGEEGRITAVKRTIVDPSVPGATTTLPDGQVVPGRLVTAEENILVDGQHVARDADITQLPDNRYDLYWTVTLTNPDPRNAFGGFLQLMPNTGYGEPVEATSQSVTIPPGQSQTVTLKLLSGIDDNQQADPQRGGRLQPGVTVYEGLFLKNTAGPSRHPEIADAVGLAAYDPVELATIAHDERRRPELHEQVLQALQAGQLSALSVEALHRPLGLHIACRADQDAVAMVRAVSASAARVGASYLVVSHRGFWQAVVANDPRQWATHPVIVQLQQVVHEARAHGLKIAWQLDVATGDSILHLDRPGASTRVREFVRRFKVLMEEPTLDMRRAHLLVLRHAEALVAEDLEWITTLFQNAQQPLMLAGAGDQPVLVGARQVPQARDLTEVADHARVLTLLQAARSQPSPVLPMAFIEAPQAAAAPALQATDVDTIVRELIGPAPAGAGRRPPGAETRPSGGGVVTPRWLLYRLQVPRRYVRPMDAVVLDALRLRTLVPFSTGHPSLVAHQIAPDAARELTLRLFVFDNRRTALKALELPVPANQYDLTKPLTIAFTDVPAGFQGAVNVEIIPTDEDRTFPSEPQRGITPGLSVPDAPAGQPRFWPLSSGAVSWVPVGQHQVGLGQGPTGWLTEPAPTGGPARRWVDEHYQVTFCSATAPTLHLGRDRDPRRVWYRVDDQPVRWLAQPAVGRLSELGETADVTVGSFRVRVVWSSEGRIGLTIGATPEEVRTRWADGQVAELWNLDDLAAAARWKTTFSATARPSVASVTLFPRTGVMTTAVRPADVPLPPLATTVPTRIVDTTAMRVVPYSRFSEKTGRYLAWTVITLII